MSKDLVYTKTQSHLYFDILWHIIVSFTSEPDHNTLVLTGYEPRAHLTSPLYKSSKTSLHKRIVLKNLSKLPTPITRSWEFTIPIPHWIRHFFHIEEGLLITFHITISAHRTAEDFNSFAIGIFFRGRSDRSLPPHQIKESRIVLGYQWPNLYIRSKKIQLSVHQVEVPLLQG